MASPRARHRRNAAFSAAHGGIARPSAALAGQTNLGIFAGDARRWAVRAVPFSLPRTGELQRRTDARPSGPDALCAACHRSSLDSLIAGRLPLRQSSSRIALVLFFLHLV